MKILFLIYKYFFIVVISRQRNLEESLLFSGQFNEALQALLDWLSKAEPGLSEEQPVHGDIETVNNLIEAHKVSSKFPTGY